MDAEDTRMQTFFMTILWFGLPALAIWQIASTRAKSIVERRCPGCEYDLTGARVGQPCPECGTIPSLAQSRFEDPERILCRHCGHDLEGLEWDADCPECGLHRAALPSFEGRRYAYPIRALLGGVLLAVWLGLTVLLFLG